MKLIKLTSITSNEIIYINPLHIGHLYQSDRQDHMGKRMGGKYTVVGVTTHNNGGFKVQETPEQILKLINK